MSIQINAGISSLNKNTSILKSAKSSNNDAAEILHDDNEEKDEVFISEQAKKMQEAETEKQRLLQSYEDQKSSSKDSAYDDMSKALEIFRRIINGDNVPAEDEKFLMEYDSEMYLRAMMLKKTKTDPKNYDSLIGDDDKSETDDIKAVSEIVNRSAQTPSSSQPANSFQDIHAEA